LQKVETVTYVTKQFSELFSQVFQSLSSDFLKINFCMLTLASLFSRSLDSANYVKILGSHSQVFAKHMPRPHVKFEECVRIRPKKAKHNAKVPKNHKNLE